MLRITGYSDKYSVCPGDEITFYVNSEKSEPYKADIVRLIHGDTNPDGPGFKEKVIKAPCNKNYKGKNIILDVYQLYLNSIKDNQK